MANLDLPVKWLEMIQQILAQHLPDAEVIVYGSRVTGTAYQGNDLDLVVRNPRDLLVATGNLGKVSEVFSESNVPILIDILDWAQIPESFRGEIERTGVVIFPGD